MSASSGVGFPYTFNNGKYVKGQESYTKMSGQGNGNKFKVK